MLTHKTHPLAIVNVTRHGLNQHSERAVRAKCARASDRCTFALFVALRTLLVAGLANMMSQVRERARFSVAVHFVDASVAMRLIRDTKRAST